MPRASMQCPSRRFVKLLLWLPFAFLLSWYCVYPGAIRMLALKEQAFVMSDFILAMTIPAMGYIALAVSIVLMLNVFHPVKNLNFFHLLRWTKKDGLPLANPDLERGSVTTVLKVFIVGTVYGPTIGILMGIHYAESLPELVQRLFATMTFTYIGLTLMYIFSSLIGLTEKLICGEDAYKYGD